MKNEQLTPLQKTEKIESLEKQIRLMRQIRSAEGFYNYWFNQLPKYKSNTECFNAVNDLHFHFFGEYKYSCYKSFQWNIRKQQKK